MKITSSLYAVLVGGVLLGSALSQADADTGGYAMGPGMMGQNPAAGTTGSSDSEPPTLNEANARKLAGYIQAQGLRCMQCHSVDDGGFGPNFLSIAANYEGNAEAGKILQERIVRGIGRMPGGFASPSQAEKLATLIIDLTAKPERKKITPPGDFRRGGH
ncbi:MAG: hypothetical protein P8Y64_01115 [Gammaproteobacteria bacterium]|jgi:cytochrome c551/c552